jgi:hypothetical protein
MVVNALTLIRLKTVFKRRDPMGPHDRSRMRDIVMSLFLSLVFLSLLIYGTGMAHAAQELPLLLSIAI